MSLPPRPTGAAEGVENNTVPEVPLSTPDRVAPQTDHSFTLQTIMHLQEVVGELRADVRTLVKTVEGLSEKIDSVNDLKPNVANLTKTVESSAKKLEKLATWKAMIIGGAVVVGVGAGAVWSAMGLVAKLIPPQSAVSTQAPVTPPAPTLLPAPSPPVPPASK